MKKNLLIALALPAMFAACSQEDIVNEEFSSNVLGTPAGKIDFILNESTDSRLSWGTTGNPVWDSENDAFSLFWVGATGENLGTNGYKSATNALYQREDGGAFTSKNIVYVGKHVIVYPADYTHVTDQEILVSVGKEQDASKSLGLRSVYVSDLLDIAKKPTDPTKIEADKMYAGYNEPVEAEVAALSSNMVLKLNFAMNDNIDEVKIKSIQLVSDKEIFAYDGYLKLDANNYMSLVAKEKGKTMTLVMPEGTKVTKESPSYTAQFALLPPVAANLSSAKYSIIVNTNFGYVTIDKAMQVTNNAGKYQIATGTSYDATVAENIDDKTALSFNTEFTDIATRNIDNKATEENEAEVSFGKRFTRNVAVDMATAEINGMKIETSQDLIDAYEVYDLLEKGKEDVVSFELIGEAIEEGKAPCTFNLNAAAAEAIAAHEFVTLTVNDNCGVLTLVNTTDKAFAAVPDLAKALGDNRAGLSLNLGAGAWTLNVKDAKIVNAYKEIHNLGSLTITDVATTNGVALNKVVCNDGTATFSGKVNMPVSYMQTKDAKTIVGTEANLYLNAGGNISGEVDVDGKMATHGGVLEINADAKIAVAGSFLTATTGTVNNLGTITLEGQGTAQVTANQNGTAMGSIVLAERSSMAKVFDSQKQGYIKWIYTENGIFTKELTDAFNCLTLKSNIRFTQNRIGDNVKHIEIAASKVSIIPTNTSYSSDKLKLNLNSVFVNENSTLVVPVGTEITTTTTVKNGDIEVYGSYITETESGNGTIYYFNGQVNVGDETALKAAITNQYNTLIVLTADVDLNAYLSLNRDITIDLNGKKITRAAKENAPAIYVTNGNVVIKNGEIEATCAVYTNGGNVTIKNGTYKGITEEGKDVTPLIYAQKGIITIEDGVFEGDIDQKFLLNCEDNNFKASSANIIVKGGSFKNYNPAVSLSENPAAKWVANGFEVKVYQGTTDVTNTKPSTAPYNSQTYAEQGCQPDWATDYVYKVVPVTTSAE